MHTPLDRDPQAQRLLPQLLGLTPREPLEAALAPMSVVTSYVPPAARDAVLAAMAAAGAGRIGDYTGCSFIAPGEGTFTVPADGDPFVGAPGSTERADEERVEMVCDRGRERAVIAACARAHPYEEPLVTVSEVMLARNAARLGMVCDAPAGETLESLAERCSARFGSTPRVWGDPSLPVSVVATTTGSAGSVLADAQRAGADVLMGGEVRYHDAMASPVAVIELGHDVSEWPLVDVLYDAVAGLPGVDKASITKDPPAAGWWTPQRRTDEGR